MRKKNSLKARLSLGACLCWFVAGAACSAAETNSLPDPLTMEAALSVSLGMHPDMQRQQAQLAMAHAQIQQAAAIDDATLDLDLEARWAEPSEFAIYDDRNDSRASLVLQKTLYDFGRTRHAVNAGEAQVLAEEKRLYLQQQAQKLAVMSDYFSVILADLAYATENESMATAFVTFDRAKDRNELGELSDVDLFTAESAYQTQRMVRMRAAAEQRHSRERLALTLNRPGELSSDVLPPELPGMLNSVPEFQDLLAEAEKNNPGLVALKHQVLALQEQRDSVRAEKNPQLFLRMEAIEYERVTPSRDPFIAALSLEVPLYRGQRTNSAIAAEEANIQVLKAELVARQYEIRRELLKAWQAVNTLLLQRTEAAVRSDYRELYLDRSRAQYELEIKTDLGDAMVQQTAARLFSVKTDFELALAREQLVLLTGNPGYSALSPAEEKPEENQH